MYILLGCLLGFISGAGVCLIMMRHVGQETQQRPVIAETKTDDRERLIKQWDNFLNYNGDATTGGDM